MPMEGSAPGTRANGWKPVPLRSGPGVICAPRPLSQQAIFRRLRVVPLNTRGYCGNGWQSGAGAVMTTDNRFAFVGVATGNSAIMRVFPEWVRYLGLTGVRAARGSCSSASARRTPARSGASAS